MTTEVRFYPAVPREGVVWYDGTVRGERRIVGHRGHNDRMEFDGSYRTRAIWNGFGPVRFPNPNIKLLLPVAGRRFANFEELGEALRGVGYFVTDLRKTLGNVANPYDAMALLVDRVVETFNGEIIILRRFPDGTHEGVWQLDEDVFKTLRRSKLVSLSKTAKYGNFSRQVFECGPRTFDTISDYHRVLLARTMERMREKQRLAREASSSGPPPDTTPSDSARAAIGEGMRRTNVVAFPAPPPDGYTSAFARPLVPWSGRTHRRPKNPLDPSSVAGFDDDGKPILEIEVARERTRTVPRNMPTNLIPDAPDGCSDDEWERLMLIEQIKYRRRVSAKLASGGNAS